MNRPIAEQDKDVRRLIIRIRKLMLASRLVRGLVIWSTVSLGMWLILFLLDNLLHLPAGLRLALSAGWVLVIIFASWQLLLRPVLTRQRPEATTLFIEREFAIVVLVRLQERTKRRTLARPRRADDHAPHDRLLDEAGFHL